MTKTVKQNGLSRPKMFLAMNGLSKSLVYLLICDLVKEDIKSGNLN